MTYLLDTSVVSELRRRQPDANVLAWHSTVDSADLFISVLSIGEIRLGVERLRRKDVASAEVIERWLAGLEATYRDHLIDVDARIADEWGHLNAPDPLPVIDGLLAATAKVRGCTLVTRNVADLRRCGVPLLNPFESG
jgi:predicted nucleic acid-binding protein